jgi:hypothetical protein
MGRSVNTSLKKAIEAYLLHESFTAKDGLWVPTDHWFRNELKEMTYDTLLSQRASSAVILIALIQSMLDRHQAGENWQYLIWNLLMLEMWHLMFVDQSLPYPTKAVV